MNKQEIVTRMSQICEGTKKDAEKALMAFIQTVEEALGNGDKVQLIGHFTLGVKPKKGREMHNPQNVDEKVTVPNKMIPFCKIGKVLKDVAEKVPYVEKEKKKKVD